jgi:hypothetical protein
VALHLRLAAAERPNQPHNACRAAGSAGLPVPDVVPTTVAQVDTADERQILGLTPPSYDDQLLMMGAATAYALVEARLAAALI